MSISFPSLLQSRLFSSVNGDRPARIRRLGWVFPLVVALAQLITSPVTIAQRATPSPEADKVASAKASAVPQVQYPAGTIYTVAGNGAYTYAGDGSKATVGSMRSPEGLTVYNGNFYIADSGNDIIREVNNTTGDISTVAGTPVAGGYTGDNGPATSARLNHPQDVKFDKAGNMYIADGSNNAIRRVDTKGNITTFAGTGTAGYNGDGGQATAALLNGPTGLAFDPTYANLYIADQGNNVVRIVNIASGVINTFAGTGTAVLSGDGGPASLADLNQPAQLFVDAAGNLYITDLKNYAIREVDAKTGDISTLAGNGNYSYSYPGNGTPASGVTLRGPVGIVVDSAGNVFFSDSGMCVIFEIVAATKDIKIVAGTQYSAGFSGDGGQSTAALLNQPQGLALDTAGDLYLSDAGNQRVREIVDVATVSGVTLPPTFSPPAGTYTTTQSVVISDATPDAVIYYTTDGTTPTTGSPQYGGAIAVTDTTTIMAFAQASGDSPSSIVSATYTINAPVTVATPIFSPASGTYTSAQTVTISDATAGASIYFTTDGSTPTASSTKYSGSFTVSTTETIKAIALATGDTNSAVASATYTISLNTVATPTFSPGAGSYTSAQTVTIGDATAGASIYYTTDGSTPTASSTKYTSPITVGVTETIKAIAIAAGFTNSAVGSAAYTIQLPAATPVISVVTGTYTTVQKVTITDTTAGAVIHYTTDGSTPTTSSAIYISTITVNSSETLKAIAVAAGYSNSAVVTATYTINLAPATTPIFSPAPGTYTSVQTVTISDATAGATIYYTTDGSTPTTSSTPYSGAITVNATETIKAIAGATGNSNSAVASATYTINLPVTATPTFSPSGGTYTSVQTVSIGDATSGASIYYTTDGSTPTTASTKYAGVITVNATETIKAIATASNHSNSAVGSAAYTINLPVAATPIFSPSGGTYTSVQTVSINDATAGASVYYTTDGSTPTTASTKYTGAIAVNSTETIKAIAAATGYTNSAVASGAYTINLPAAATPTFSPSAGTYTAVQTVSISDTTSGASVYYTTDGSTPTTASTKYTGTITVGVTETLKAIAAATGYSNSAVGSAAYTINLPQPVTATPTFSPAAGTYTSVQSVTISDMTSGAGIYYTTDGSTPTASSTKYSGAITVSATETIKAVAIASGYMLSPVAMAAYTINLPPPVAATPAFSPAAGTYTSVQSVTISDTTTGAVIYYTTDGTTPTTSSTKYTAAVSVGSSETLEAIAVASGYTNSSVATAAYTINLPAAAFTLAASPSTASVTVGQSAQFMLTVTPQNGFAQAVTFTCAGLPSGDTCTFAPSSVTPAGAPVTSALTIATGSTTAMNDSQPLPLWAKVTAGISMALLLWPFRKRRVWAAFVLAILLGAGFAVVGCGGSSSSKSQNYTVTVTAAGGGVSQSTPLTLTVKN